jgi:glycine oxidase
VTGSPDVIVIGAGVLGLASAAEMAARGLSVVVVDPGGGNASSIAAGMIAPAMESALEDLPPRVVAVLQAARDLWPDFAARHGLDLIQDGADWRGRGAEALRRRLERNGFVVEARPDGFRTPEDARIDAGRALQELGRAVTVIAGSARRTSRVERHWTVRLDGDRELHAPHLVVATGAAGAIEGLPVDVVRLIEGVIPIRGQLAHVHGPGPAIPTRTPHGYVVPVEGGVIVGATMEHGRRDLQPEDAAARRQVGQVFDALGLPAGAASPRVGVRGAFADGLPAVGEIDGVIVALGPRRNGWLLAPLVAGVVADAVRATPPGPQAASLRPDRPGLSAPAE